MSDQAKLGLGIVGLGGAAVNMLPSFRRSPHFRITAAADTDGAILDRFGHDHADAKTYLDVEQLCADADVDLVYIGTPNDVQHVVEQDRNTFPVRLLGEDLVSAWNPHVISRFSAFFSRRPATIPWPASCQSVWRGFRCFARSFWLA